MASLPLGPHNPPPPEQGSFVPAVPSSHLEMAQDKVVTHSSYDLLYVTQRMPLIYVKLYTYQLEACAHPFFDELREPNARLPNGRPLPPLFNFKQEVS
ncbi:hypothetical protein BHE74_00009467 [Ensete ventricosum]|nr:hypothetical protein BHE74_00009467 [Ensete ventricosum]